jgi:hypothetical protein
MALNVFKDYKCWSNRYRLLHPWVIITGGWRNLKAAWQRATRGYANRDTWNLDTWLLQVLPAAIKHLAKNCHGWPATDDFPTHEDWVSFLNNLANDLEDCQDDEAENRNEYYEDYMKELMDNADEHWKRDEKGNLTYTKEQTELDKKYFARARELSEEQQKKLEHCFFLLSKYLRAMWN